MWFKPIYIIYAYFTHCNINYTIFYNISDTQTHVESEITNLEFIFNRLFVLVLELKYKEVEQLTIKVSILVYIFTVYISH